MEVLIKATEGLVTYLEEDEIFMYLAVMLFERQFKTESIRKLSNFNFQWIKTFYQNNLNKTAFFLQFFKSYRYN